MRRGAVTHHDGLEVWVSLALTLGGAVENESMPPLRFWKRCEVLGDGEFPSQHGAGRAEEGRAGAEARGFHATMRSSRPRGGGRSRAADHPFPLVPRDPDDLDRRHEHLRISTAYLASMTNDPRELNAAHVAAAAQTPDATEVLASLGTYLGVPGFEPTTSGRPTEEAPPPLRKGVLPEVSPGDHDAYLEKVAGWEAFTRANADRRAREADEGGGIHPGVNGNCDANGAQQLDQASDDDEDIIIDVVVHHGLGSRLRRRRRPRQGPFDPSRRGEGPGDVLRSMLRSLGSRGVPRGVSRRAHLPGRRSIEYIEYKGRTRAKGARAVFHAVRRRHRPGHAGTTEPTPRQGGDQTCRGDRREERVVLRGFRSVTRARRDRLGDLRSDPADSPVASGSIHVRHVSTRVRHEPSQETREPPHAHPRVRGVVVRAGVPRGPRRVGRRRRLRRRARSLRGDSTQGIGPEPGGPRVPQGRGGARGRGGTAGGVLARVGVHARGEGTARVGGTPGGRNGLRVGNRRLIIRANREKESQSRGRMGTGDDARGAR